MQSLRTLRSLRLSPYPNVQDFNIPEIVDDMDNLRELWIEALEPVKVTQVTLDAGIVSSQPAAPPIQISTDLRKEMEGYLPPKLKKLTISGHGFTQLSDNVLNVCFMIAHDLTCDTKCFYREFNHHRYTFHWSILA